ncbi:MAG: peptidoglycan-binding protein, partial [Desulfuromonadales bacterium]
LSPDVLEQVRLLTNLETSTQKLLQIILIGQPELRTLLQREDMRQLAQRVTARYRLEPLNREETGAYITHRLHICGATRRIFRKSAVDLIYKLSGGIPRLINVLCDRALLGAFTEGKFEVDRKVIRQAADEVLADELRQTRARFSPRWSVVVPVVGVLAVVALYVFQQHSQDGNWLDQAAAQSSAELSASDDPVEEPPPRDQDAPALPAEAVPKPTSPGPEDTPGDSLETVLLPANESWPVAAWTHLFARWSVDLPAVGAPGYCVFASSLGLQCRADKGSWGLLRQYDRPAIMMLTTPDGHSVPAVLQQLGDRVAELMLGDELVKVDIGEVDRYWRGEFTILLRLPPNGNPLLTAGDRTPDVVWLRELLEAAQQVKLPADDPQYFDTALQTQVMEFQRRHGLMPDGVVGKQTLIQLNNYSDRKVPLLLADSS